MCFQLLDFGTSQSNSEVSKSNSKILVENYLFLTNYIYVTSEGAVSNNVVYYHINLYQVSCCADIYFAYEQYTNSVQCL